MARPLIPPRGVFIPTGLLFDKDLPAAARDTCCQVKALAWGQAETPPISFGQLAKLTGKSVSTLYEHVRLLRARGVLRWRPAGSAMIIFAFTEAYACDPDLQGVVSPTGTGAADLPVTEFQNSGKPEVPDPINTLTLITQTQDQANSEIPENRKTGKRAKAAGKPAAQQVSSTRAIKDKYCELLGYTPNSWMEGEGAASKAIADAYTVEEFERVYRHIKAQGFWNDKELKLRYIRGQMQGTLAYLGGRNGNGRGQGTGAGGPREADQDAADEVNKRRAERAGVPAV